MPEIVPEKAQSIYEFSACDLSGKSISFEKYNGCLLLVLNVPEYGDTVVQNYLDILSQIHYKFGGKDVKVLLFISDQIVCSGDEKHREKYEDLHIRGVCDVFEKIDLNGGRAHPVYKYLKKRAATRGTSILDKSFTVFIVDRMGVPVSREHHSIVTDLDRFEAVLMQHL